MQVSRVDLGEGIKWLEFGTFVENPLGIPPRVVRLDGVESGKNMLIVLVYEGPYLFTNT